MKYIKYLGYGFLLILLMVIVNHLPKLKHTDYESIVKDGEVIKFTVDKDDIRHNADVEYKFTMKSGRYTLYINGEEDSSYDMANTKDSVLLSGEWSSFLLVFEEGDLTTIKQMVHENKDRGVEKETIIFEM